MKSLVELAYDKHKDWINIVKSFGANKNYAEDIVQEMYIQLICDIQKGLDLSYNDDINTYYCYKVLRGIYLNTHKKEAKFLKTYIEDINGEIKEVEDLGIDEIEYAKRKDNIDDILKEMYWYDSKVLTLVYYITYYTGIRYIWKKINPDCGCDKRRDEWNDIDLDLWK